MRALLTNHVSKHFDVEPRKVWDNICHTYKDGDGFKAAGFEISPLEDPAAFRGGYRMILRDNDTIVDEREVFIAEIDHQNYRLSAFARYLRPALSQMEVTACYQALPERNGCSYLLDCWTWMDIDCHKNEFAEKVAKLEAQFNDALHARLSSLRGQL